MVFVPFGIAGSGSEKYYSYLCSKVANIAITEDSFKIDKKYNDHIYCDFEMTTRNLNNIFDYLDKSHEDVVLFIFLDSFMPKLCELRNINKAVSKEATTAQWKLFLKNMRRISEIKAKLENLSCEYRVKFVKS